LKDESEHKVCTLEISSGENRMSDCDDFRFTQPVEECFLCKGKAECAVHDCGNHKYTRCPECGHYIITAFAASHLKQAPADTLKVFAKMVADVDAGHILWIMRAPLGSVQAVTARAILRIEGDGSPATDHNESSIHSRFLGA
jgi:hypothetical protein